MTPFMLVVCREPGGYCSPAAWC